MAGLEEKISNMTNLVDLLRYRSQTQALETAFIFLPEGEREEVTITYRALDEKARAIASVLQAMDASGERAILLYQPGLDFIVSFLGCLYAGVIAVPAYPPRNNHHNHRLQAIVEDADAKIALTATSIFSHMEQKINAEPTLAKLTYINTDDIDSSQASSWQSPLIVNNGLAFLQYTSGSTGKPKGVMISHENLLYNERMIQQAFGSGSKTIAVGWLPVYHDMGLIGNILQPLYLGRPCIFMPPGAFLRQPIRWLQAISRYQATSSGGPNFAYDLCVKKIKPEQLESLDLSSWEVAFTGAEPIRDRTLNRFAEKFACCGFKKEAFYPCYGMAETTLLVSGGVTTEAPSVCFVDETELLRNRVLFVDNASVDNASRKAKAIVSSGHTWLDQKIAIVHPETCRQCSDEDIGEIWVSGDNVAQGYWQKPDLNGQTFKASIIQENSEAGEGAYLRTGDLGFLKEGELFVTGRLKDVVIIRGQNHYPQDIEHTVENSHQALASNASAAFSIDIGGEEKLVVMAEVERRYHREIRKYQERRQSTESESTPLSAPPIFQDIISKVKENIVQNHGLNAHAVLLLRIGTIPKTSSGKIQRYACKKAFTDRSINIIENWSEEACQQANFQELESTIESLLDEIKKRQLAEPIGDNHPKNKPVKFSLLYFSSNEAEFEDNKYRLLLEGAKFADQHDFHAVWIPERHFHPFGGLYPEPSILGGVLGSMTERVRIRPGSVVLPLQNPVRVAEQWSVVDNLSAGRVDMSFARGWNPNDFVLAPENYEDRTQIMLEGISTIQKLWRGEAISLPNGNGKETEIKIYPLPKQPELPVWITCSGSKERFVEAGKMGANVLTALLFQPIEDLAEKIRLYREARAQNGHDPETGCVSLMLHTFVGQDLDFVRDRVRQPFMNYLESSIDLWRNESNNLNELTPDEKEKVLGFAFERYFQTTALFGTPESCLPMVEKLKGIGVDEIACLIDFGIEADSVLSNLTYLDQLRITANESPLAQATEASQAKPIFIHRPKDKQVEQASAMSQLKTRLSQCIAAALEVDTHTISPDSNFFHLGIDSLKASEIIGDLERLLKISISPAAMFEHSTINTFSLFLVEQHNLTIENGEIVANCEPISENLSDRMNTPVVSQAPPTLYPGQAAALSQRTIGEL